MNVALSILLALTVCANLGGCSPNDMKYTSVMNARDREIMTVSIDTVVYEDVIEGIFVHKGGERSEVEEFVSKYEPLLSSDFIEWYLSESYVRNEQPLEELYGFDLDSEDYAWIAEETEEYEEEYEWTDYEYSEPLEGEVDDEADVEDDSGYEKLYTVLSIDAYAGKLVSMISYNYGGSWKVVFYLNADNQIDGYRIYR